MASLSIPCLLATQQQPAISPRKQPTYLVDLLVLLLSTWLFTNQFSTCDHQFSTIQRYIWLVVITPMISISQPTNHSHILGKIKRSKPTTKYVFETCRVYISLRNSIKSPFVAGEFRLSTDMLTNPLANCFMANIVWQLKCEWTKRQYPSVIAINHIN